VQSELGIALSLAAGLLMAMEVGYRLGVRAVREKEAPGGSQVGAIQGATLGLLGLLLGFSFAGAAARFLERQDLIVQEANAIGTAYLRVDLLEQPHRSHAREALTAYVRHLLEVSERLRYGLTPEDRRRISDYHQGVWKAASEGVSAKPAAMIAVLVPVNEMIDLHATRVAASRKHLPHAVMALLIVCSTLATGAIGYGCGLSRRRCLIMTGSLVMLIAAALWLTIDLDYPRAGLIQLDDSALRELQFSAQDAPPVTDRDVN